ncbi:MAG: oxidoreductase [Armatimonadota bacterium]
MMEPQQVLFSELELQHIMLPNRLVRSATYEGLAEADGTPKPELAELYCDLARGGVGTIITGFVYTSQQGRAMHPAQCGIDSDDKVIPWRQIVERVRAANPSTKLIMQLAHTGRQTQTQVTGQPVVGASSRSCSYFRQRVRALDENAILAVIQEFAEAASRAKQAGFDGVQIHAAHGYLIHQFLSPWTNNRTDHWSDRPLLLEQVITAVQASCGEGFPILLKLSAAEDRSPGIRVEQTIETVQRLKALHIDAVEISYGTMEYALNIIRGDVPVAAVMKVNPMFRRVPKLIQGLWKRYCAPAYIRKFIPFTENYNLQDSLRIRTETGIPVLAVGGIRSLESMISMVGEMGIDAVSLCRPLICEPDLPNRILDGRFTRSQCTNCNLCAIYCDSRQPLRCHRQKRTGQSVERD